MSDPVSLVYFIRAGDFVKVGVTVDIHRRMHTLSTASPIELELLGVIEGDAEYERHVHAVLAEFHHRREWFRAEPDLLAAISGIARPVDVVMAEAMGPRVRAMFDGVDTESGES